MKKIISVFILTMFALAFLTCKKADKDPNDKLSLTQLNSKPSATPTPTTPTTSTVTLAFWATSSIISNGGGSIYVYLDGSYIGTLSTGLSSAPACTSSFVVKKNILPGLHEYYAVSTNGFYEWGNSQSDGISINVSSSSCNTKQLF